MRVEFEFPEGTLYPCLPVILDTSSTCFPLRGETMVNHMEVRTAGLYGCRIKVIEAVYTPPKTDQEGNVIRPYITVIRMLQNERTAHPKGSVNNVLYKLLLNSIYGMIAMGLNSKITRESLGSPSTESFKTGSLSNPFIAAYITSLVRSVLAEIMFYIEQQGGDFISATTDGFITNYGAEEALNSISDHRLVYSKLFSNNRVLLGHTANILELKGRTRGIAT